MSPGQSMKTTVMIIKLTILGTILNRIHQSRPSARHLLTSCCQKMMPLYFHRPSNVPSARRWSRGWGWRVTWEARTQRRQSTCKYNCEIFCMICSKYFAKKLLLLLTFRCEYCGWICHSEDRLRIHSIQHVPPKLDHLCSLCGAAFFSVTDLERHELNHQKRQKAEMASRNNYVYLVQSDSNVVLPTYIVDS